MIELYHNAFSTCSQKVRLVFAEKGIPFESREINLITGEQHDPDYVKLNPKHVVPTIVHDGRALIESSLLIRYLDDLEPRSPMRPADAYGRYVSDAWIQRVDDSLHPAAPIVTFALGPRNALMQQPEEVREANVAGIPDPAARAIRRSVLAHGVKAPEFAGALHVFIKVLDDMETQLAERPWLSGENFGLADATLLPYVLRLEHLGMDPLLDPQQRPRVADWFARVRARPSYAEAVEAWLVAPIVAMLRKSGEEAWADLETVIASAPPAA